MKPVKKVLEHAELSRSEIHEVILVGGSTRIPKIQQLIKELFHGKVRIISVCTVTVTNGEFALYYFLFI